MRDVRDLIESGQAASSVDVWATRRAAVAADEERIDDLGPDLDHKHDLYHDLLRCVSCPIPTAGVNTNVSFPPTAFGTQKQGRARLPWMCGRQQQSLRAVRSGRCIAATAMERCPFFTVLRLFWGSACLRRGQDQTASPWSSEFISDWSGLPYVPGISGYAFFVQAPSCAGGRGRKAPATSARPELGRVQ